MQKFFILGLDGLEYDLVERWNLKSLKQHEYGKIDVPINERLGVPTSPEVWASFLTGRHMKKEIARKFPIGTILRVMKFIRRHLNIGFGLGKVLTKKAAGRFPALKEKTFLDITRSKEVNVPYYSYDHATFDINHRFLTKKISLEEALDDLKSVYKNSKRRILDKTEMINDFDVVFAFMHFPDILQHLLLTRPQRIKYLYYDLDHYVLTLKKRIRESFTFIIISDHGFALETGLHSDHGYYSSNKPLNPKPKQITDFFWIIIRDAKSLG